MLKGSGLLALGVTLGDGCQSDVSGYADRGLTTWPFRVCPLCLLRSPYPRDYWLAGLFAGLFEVRVRLRTAGAEGWRILVQP